MFATRFATRSQARTCRAGRRVGLGLLPGTSHSLRAHRPGAAPRAEPMGRRSGHLHLAQAWPAWTGHN